MTRRRIVLLLVAALLVPVGLGARTLPGALGDVAGGLLYAALLVVLCAFVAPAARSLSVGLVAAAIGVGIELLQLTGLPAALASAVPLSRVVLGSTFVVTDLLVAVLGAAGAAAVDALVRRARASRVVGGAREPAPSPSAPRSN